MRLNSAPRSSSSRIRRDSRYGALAGAVRRRAGSGTARHANRATTGAQACGRSSKVRPCAAQYGLTGVTARLPAARRPRRARAGGQLEVGARARHLKEDAVVAVVVAEPADLDQAEAVAVERDQRLEALGVAGDAQLHPLTPRCCAARRR